MLDVSAQERARQIAELMARNSGMEINDDIFDGDSLLIGLKQVTPPTTIVARVIQKLHERGLSDDARAEQRKLVGEHLELRFAEFKKMAEEAPVVLRGIEQHVANHFANHDLVRGVEAFKAVAREHYGHEYDDTIGLALSFGAFVIKSETF